MADIGSAAAYLFTNNSNNQATRSIGQAAAIGGLIYGRSQKNKSSQIKSRNFNYLKNAIQNISNNSISSFRTEVNLENKRLFLQKVLAISSYFDEFIKEYASSVKRKSALTSNSQNLLMMLNNQEIFYYKIKLNSYLKQIDNSIYDTSHLQIYNRDITKINKTKLKNESYLMIALIISSIILCFIFSQNSYGGLSMFFLISAVALYLVHTFYPFLEESRKLKSIANQFVNQILKTVPITNINF